MLAVTTLPVTYTFLDADHPGPELNFLVNPAVVGPASTDIGKLPAGTTSFGLSLVVSANPAQASTHPIAIQAVECGTANVLGSYTAPSIDLSSPKTVPLTVNPLQGGLNCVDIVLVNSGPGTHNTVNISAANSLNFIVNRAPVAVTDDYGINVDALLDEPANGVLANDTDADAGAVLKAVLVSDVSHGTLDLHDDGSFSYMPVLGFNGIDSFTYKANDGIDDSNATTVNITVNDQPTVLSPIADQFANVSVPYSLDAGSHFGDDDTITFSTSPLPTWLSIDATTGVLSGTPTAADLGTTTIEVTATDGLGDHISTSFDLLVKQTIVSLSTPQPAVRGQATSITFSATDADPAAEAAGFAFTIKWGDGQTQTIPQPLEPENNGIQTLQHTYAATGIYKIKVIAANPQGALGAFARIVNIDAVAIQHDPLHESQTNLAIGGTTGNDTIRVTAAPNNRERVFINGVQIGGDYQVNGRILVFGQKGNDSIQVSQDISLTAILDGGKGNDDLRGGGGHDVLLGGPGLDYLVGRAGRDLLIGGASADTLEGNGEEDILIAGTTKEAGASNHELSTQSLLAVLAEWSSSRSLSQRLRNLQGPGFAPRANGDVFLVANESTTDSSKWTVLDDEAKDIIFARRSRDWFFASLASEVVNDRFSYIAGTKVIGDIA